MNVVSSGRKYVIYGTFASVAIIYLLRLFYMQVIDEHYKLSAINSAIRIVTDYAPRGFIYDRKGKLIVYNEPVYDLMLIPNQVDHPDTTEICGLLSISKDDFVKKLSAARKFSRNLPSVLEKQLSKETYARLQEKLYKFPGFFTQSRTLRRYPIPTAAHLLGYIAEVDSSVLANDKYYKEGDYIGKSGIEFSYEEALRGKRGVRRVMVDKFNREKGSFADGIYDTASVPGQNIVLTLDAELQRYGECLMQNKIGGIVAIEPSTGEILACVSNPSYDPNLLVGRERTANYVKLSQDPLKPLFNRALMAYYPPGSTFKLINDLIGQQEGVLFPTTRYYCDGAYHMPSHDVGCDERHGWLDLVNAIAHSCNTYHCYVFKSIIDNKNYATTEQSYDAWRNHVLTFGIGKRLYSDLPQELKGNVPSVPFYDKYYGKGHWKFSNLVSLSIGQGELGITPLQMANTMAVIANRGYYYVPHMIKKIGDSTTVKKQFTEKNYTDIDAKYYEIVVDGMENVVEMGTAAASKIKGITICGKTGTAQNPHGKNHSLFVAFAPRDNPKIAIGIMVENAGWGAEWAAPIASLMIEKYLTDSISRPQIEKKMLDGVILPKLDQPKTTSTGTTKQTKIIALKNVAKKD